MTLSWHPERLNAAIAKAYQASLKVAEADAEASGKGSAGAALVGNRLSPTGPGKYLEEGTRPHTEEGSQGFVYLKGLNRFVSGPVKNPGMKAEPYIRPAAARWATQGFQRVARAMLRGSGF